MNTGQIKAPQTHVAANMNSTPNAQTSVIRISPASSASSIITNNSVNSTYQPFHPEHVPGIVTNSGAVILTTASIAYNNGTGATVNEHATIPKNGINSGSVHSWTTLLPLIDAPNKNQKTTTITTSHLKPESASVPVSHDDGDGRH